VTDPMGQTVALPWVASLMQWLAYTHSVTMPLTPVRLTFPHHDSETQILASPRKEKYSRVFYGSFMFINPYTQMGIKGIRGTNFAYSV
jgi:hypothetical protein